MHVCGIPPSPYLHGLHESVVSTLQELGAEVLQHQSNAVRRHSFVGQVCHRPSQFIGPPRFLLTVVRTLLQTCTTEKGRGGEKRSPRKSYVPLEMVNLLRADLICDIFSVFIFIFIL